jgi:hypothetical protein
LDFAFKEMTLAPGTKLGPYEILSPIRAGGMGEQLGRGGMGEVYLADDLNLNRKVALKFLPEAFTGDPERMARFEREAKLLASLNHPNIAAIYGLEQAEGKRFLVLEFADVHNFALFNEKRNAQLRPDQCRCSARAGAMRNSLRSPRRAAYPP